MQHPFEEVAEARLGSSHLFESRNIFSKLRLESLNALQAQLAADTFPVKANLVYGFYKPDNGQALVLKSVKRVRDSSYLCTSGACA